MPSRSILVGGHSKEALLHQLRGAQIQLNAYASAFMADDRFKVSEHSYSVDIETCSLRELGLIEGGSFAQLLAAARAAGLHPCPAELGPCLRLQLLEQEEDHRVDTRNERGAPYGSITVASEPLSDDDEFPKGLYLRRLDGCLWLRGYRSWAGHIWSPADVFAFMRPAPAVAPHGAR